MAKFTKGPWEFNHDSFIVWNASGDVSVAEVDVQGSCRKERIANGQLIAAAPRLYAAAEAVICNSAQLPKVTNDPTMSKVIGELIDAVLMATSDPISVTVDQLGAIHIGMQGRELYVITDVETLGKDYAKLKLKVKALEKERAK